MSKEQDVSLSLKEKWQLFVHLRICGLCKAYRRHMCFLKKACSLICSKVNDCECLGEAKLSDPARERLQSCVKDACAKQEVDDK